LVSCTTMLPANLTLGLLAADTTRLRSGIDRVFVPDSSVPHPTAAGPACDTGSSAGCPRCGRAEGTHAVGAGSWGAASGGAAGRVGERGGGAGDGELAVFERLAQHFQHLALELGQLVQEEDTMVGQAHLARPGDGAAADEAGVGDEVVGRAEGAGGDQGGVGGQEAGDGVDLRALQRFLEGEGREDRGVPTRSVPLLAHSSAHLPARQFACSATRVANGYCRSEGRQPQGAYKLRAVRRLPPLRDLSPLPLDLRSACHNPGDAGG
jgi:hypothetical protein